MQASTILSLRRVGFAYQKQQEIYNNVIQDLNLDIERGDWLAVQGPSGSGKSTLFYLIGCMLRPQQGTIHFLGKDISTFNDLQLSQFRNRHLGFVFQQFHLLPRASVLSNIMLPVSYPLEFVKANNDYEKHARYLAEKLNLTEHLTKMPHELSGGQQQRVAIARALMREPELILADEPTGNLDSKNAEEVLALFKQLNDMGKTIVIITHDAEVAKRCRRTIYFRDGNLSQPADGRSENLGRVVASDSTISTLPIQSSARVWLASLPIVLANLIRNKMKSFLTALGVTIGVASILAMLSLGEFVKRRILEGYESLGVNKLQVYGYRDWQMKLSDMTSGPIFQSFNWDRDLAPLKEMFPEIALLSPLTHSWGVKVTYSGRQVDRDISVIGVNDEYDAISNAEVAYGRFFSKSHVERSDKVCLLGAQVPQQLMARPSELINDYVFLKFQGGQSTNCRVLGILKSQKSNSEWFKPDEQIILPFSFAQLQSPYWDRSINRFVLKIDSPQHIEDVGAKITNYFKAKYGVSGEFRVDGDSKLIAQMKLGLSIFTVLLVSVAAISLLVGAIGIHNMMLVSIADRLKEIGLRRALGATASSIRILFLAEAVMTCFLGGVLGIIIGLIVCQLGIWLASQVVTNLKMEFIFEPVALVVAVVSMILTGLFSGLLPARKAERLSVIEALRSD